MVSYMPWYRNAIVYCVDIEKFADGNDDGIGDFIGLAEKVPYLGELGVDCLWLLPFFRSPRKDNGYDVADHYSVDPRFGTFEDFIAFVRRAKSHGIRVIIDIVMNHTSDEHHWFRAARHDPDSTFRDYYIWSSRPILAPEDEPSFPGEVDSLWTWDDLGSGYYFHRFYPFQPSLQLGNHAVVEEMKRIMDFWLSFGIDGFRIDALPMMTMPPGKEKSRPDDILKEIRTLLQRRRQDEVLLAEVDLPPEELPDYLGDGEHVDMIQNYIIRGFMLLALARGHAGPLVDGLDSMPAAHDRFQWLTFLSSHDEINLAQLHEEHSNEVIAAFSPDPHTHAFGRGVRRRIAPIIGGSAQYKLLYSLLFCLPGAPLMLYGDEIGIGDDLTQPEREAVRVLMQWDDTKNGGFSSAPVKKLIHPPLPDGEFGYKNGVDVRSQREDPDSLLSWFKQLIKLRRDAQEIGYGAWRLVPAGNDAVFIIKWDWEGRWLMAAHNLSGSPQTFGLRLEEYNGSTYELVMGEEVELRAEEVELGPYGFAWWRIPYQRQ
jgi:maltose alpha-D-glucosyltransferase / alpha-amylase